MLIDLLFCIPGLLFVWYIGKTFYNLAFKFDVNNKLGWAILGITVFYAGVFAVGFISVNVLGIDLTGRGDAKILFIILLVITVSRLLSIGGLLISCFGLIPCVFLYFRLKKRWKAKRLMEKKSRQDQLSAA